MRITVTSGDRTVELSTEPREKVQLRAAEKAVLRLLHAIPPAKPEPQQAFGFCLSADIQIAPAPEPAYIEYEDCAP